MKLLSLLALLPSALAVAIPQATTATGAAATPSPSLVPTGPEYHLKSKLVNDNETVSKAKFDGLYLVATHTGAGLNDAVFSSQKQYAIKGFQNITESTGESYQEFDLGNYWPYGLNLGYAAYAAWSPVTIDAGQGDDGFILQANGVVSTTGSFGGWLACDWWHNEPQLFYINKFYPLDTPSSCAQIYLVKEDL
ncbi:uncharacterized protein K452DRAFT_305054 [Aplosporella prunicola CBS 121167]|uniref:DUF7907 domain-containing protein n=1 Tax=Aplosporella prunicola CBS 121167 TaxID=1176127 RepID=A0A6A6BQN9_9PEZI|nr:uncharacterized protein K452DRAFT_305054 [Aplosporella prunicola CBS 121167]KAF2146068.1 hypothetical protein K452DRAFT_305054 [Aplosporella prunicola CBS 121167]